MQFPSIGDMFLMSAVTGAAVLVEIGFFIVVGLI